MAETELREAWLENNGVHALRLSNRDIYNLLPAAGELAPLTRSELWLQPGAWYVSYVRKNPSSIAIEGASELTVSESHVNPELLEEEKAKAWALRVLEDADHKAASPSVEDWQKKAEAYLEIQHGEASYYLGRPPSRRVRVGTAVNWTQEAHWHLIFQRFLVQPRRDSRIPVPIIIERHYATSDQLDVGEAEQWALDVVEKDGFGPPPETGIED
jgi:hypothetical protein